MCSRRFPAVLALLAQATALHHLGDKPVFYQKPVYPGGTAPPIVIKPLNSHFTTPRPDPNLPPAVQRHIVTAVCGLNDYSVHAMRMVKSIALNSMLCRDCKRTNWTLHYFTEGDARSMAFLFGQQLANVAKLGQSQSFITVQLHKVSELDTGSFAVNLHRPCDAAWVNVPHALPEDVKEFLWVPPDSLVMEELSAVWDDAEKNGWNPRTRLMAVTEESVLGTVYHDKESHWNRFGRHGLSTGVMLVSTAGMREQRFAEWAHNETLRSQTKDPSALRNGNEDLVNRFMVSHPELLVVLQCNANVRRDSNCDVRTKPPIVLHGSGGAFGDDWRWSATAKKVDDLHRQSREGTLETTKSSLWGTIGAEVRVLIEQTLSKPWGLSPQGTDTAVRMHMESGTFRSYADEQREAEEAKKSVALAEAAKDGDPWERRESHPEQALANPLDVLPTQ